MACGINFEKSTCRKRSTNSIGMSEVENGVVLFDVECVTGRLVDPSQGSQ